MSVKIMSQVWAHSKCAGTELLTVLALADWADEEGWCWPSLTKLAEKTRVNVSQICKILTAIEKQTGEIQRDRSTGGRNKRTRYRVAIDGNSVIRNSVPDDSVVRENSVIGNSVAENSVAENSVASDKKTVSPVTDALIRHRSVSIYNTDGTQKTGVRSKHKSKPAIPETLRGTVEQVVSEMNHLAGTQYQPTSKIVLNGLVQRLKAGATEEDCLLVVRHKWEDWGHDPEMRQHFNPETLFRESKFEKYLNAARMKPAEPERAWGEFVG